MDCPISLKCFSSVPNGCLNVGSHFPSVHLQVQSSSHSSFSPYFFCPTEFAWFYIYFSGDQVLLLALSWCSARSSVSEVTFLMNPWREKYTLSIYASTTLDFLNIPIVSFLRNSVLFSTKSVSVYFPISSIGRFSFHHTLSSIYCW